MVKLADDAFLASLFSSAYLQKTEDGWNILLKSLKAVDAKPPEYPTMDVNDKADTNIQPYYNIKVDANMEASEQIAADANEAHDNAEAIPADDLIVANEPIQANDAIAANELI